MVDLFTIILDVNDINSLTIVKSADYGQFQNGGLILQSIAQALAVGSDLDFEDHSGNTLNLSHTGIDLQLNICSALILCGIYDSRQSLGIEGNSNRSRLLGAALINNSLKSHAHVSVCNSVEHSSGNSHREGKCIFAFIGSGRNNGNRGDLALFCALFLGISNSGVQGSAILKDSVALVTAEELLNNVTGLGLYRHIAFCYIIGVILSECATSDNLLVCNPRHAIGVLVNHTPLIKESAIDRNGKILCFVNGIQMDHTFNSHISANRDFKTAGIAVSSCLNSAIISNSGYSATGNIKNTLICRSSGILQPYITSDVASTYIDDIFSGSAICITSNSITLCSGNLSTFNIYSSSIVATGNIINYKQISAGSGLVLHFTTLYGQGSTSLIIDSSYSGSASSIFVGNLADFTFGIAIHNNQCTSIGNHAFIFYAGSITKSISSKINSESFACSNYIGNSHFKIACKHDFSIVNFRPCNRFIGSESHSRHRQKHRDHEYDRQKSFLHVFPPI